MKPKYKSRQHLGLIVVGFAAAALSLFVTQSAQAAAQTWDFGAGTSNWDDPFNWTNDQVPSAGAATINTATGFFPVITATPTLATPTDIIVGATAAGRLDVRGGTLSTGLNNYLIIGRGLAGVGTLNLADTSGIGGSLTGFAVGTGGANVGGASTTVGRLLVGDASNSVGTVNMNTSGTLLLEDDGIGLLMGGGGTSTGNFRLDAGTVTINSNATTGIAILGGTNGGDGNFSMSGGTVNANGGVWLGDNNGGSQGVFNISGGTFTATGTGGVVVVGGGNNNTTEAGQHFIGRGLGQGTFNVSGTANVTLNGTTHIGWSGTATTGTSGILTVSGGSFTNSGELRVGSGQAERTAAAAGTGTFNVSGGTASLGSLTLARGDDAADTVTGSSTISGASTILNVTNDVVVAFAGNTNLGQMTINTGATVNAGTSGAKTVVVNQWDTSRGQLTVNGGTLNLYGNSDLRFSNGNGVGASFVTLSGGAITSYSGNGTGSTTTGELDMNRAGAAAANNTFNLDGGTLTIQQVISTSNNGTAVFNLNGGTLKAANSSVNFVDLGGATQTAVVKSGGALIDSNGFNVTIPQALLDGTGGGGLTKSGAGALALTAVSGYTGATLVSAGTLTVGAAGSINASSGITVNGSGAKFLQTSSVAGTKPVTLTQGTLDGTGSVGAVTVGAGTGSVVANGNGGTGVLTLSSLSFSGAGGLNLNLANTTAGGLAVTGAVITGANNTVTVNTLNVLALGTTYNLVSAADFSGSDLSDYIYGGNTTRKNGTFGYAAGFLNLTVTGDTPKWTGGDNGNWVIGSTGANSNWNLISANTATDYIPNDDVLFDDSATGPTTINISGGVVNPNSVVFNNSSLAYSIGGAGIADGTAPTSLVKNGTAKATLTNANTYTGVTTINAGTLELGDGTTDGSIASTSGVTNNGTLAYNLAGSQTAGYVISGTGVVTKAGAGTLTLSNTNTFGGGLSVTGGTVSVASNTALGGTGGTTGSILLDGGSLRTTAGMTNTHAFTIGAGGGTINVNSTGQYYFTTANTLLGSGTLTVVGSSGTLAGQVAGAGNLRVDKANTFSGNIIAQSGGIFEYGIANAVAPSATFSIGNEGEVAVQGSSAVPLSNAITVSGGTNSVLSFENGTLGNYTGLVTLNANATIGLRDWYNNAVVRSGTISGQVTGSGGLTVNSGSGNGGLLTLSNAANDYAGGTTISASKVLAGASSAFGSGAVTVAGANAQVQLGSDLNVANPITINSGAGTTAQGVIWVPTLNANATLSGPITINAAPTAGGHFATNGGTLTVTGAITSSVPVSSRIGTVVFSNTGSSYSQLVVNQGTVRIGATNAIPVAATVDLGASGASTLDLAGFNQTLGGITKNTNAATITNSGTSDSTLTTTGTSTFGGVIQNGATHTTAVTVSSGALTLSGTNTYTGQTVINGGTLALGATGSINNTSGVDLGTGTFDVSAVTGGYTVGNLTGSGTVIGNLSVSTQMAIGNSPGTMTFNNDLTLGGLSSSTFEFEDIGFTIASYDLAQGGAGTQAVTFGGTLNLFFSGGSYVENTSVQIFDFENYAGTFTEVNITGLDLGQSATFNPTTGFVTVVPEPSAALLGGLGALALLRRRRRSSSSSK